MAQQLIVQKYGGMTLSDPKKIREVAKRIAALRRSGTQVVAVVSAMGKTTNNLLDLAHQVSDKPKQRELDMLLTTGERVSMALLSIALNDLGCSSISFTGSQAGILTDNSHVGAHIQDIRAFRVTEALQKNQTVVLAGFQGVSADTKEITTLGRGGTDITAVAMAAFLKADRCEILKEHSAVYSADPALVKKARPLKKLSYEMLMEMSYWGAKMVNYRAAELAAQYKIPLFVGSASSSKVSGTIIGGENMFETAKVVSVNSFEKILQIYFKSLEESEAFQKFEGFLSERHIAFPQLLSAEAVDKGTRFFITGPNDILDPIERDAKGFNVEKNKLASVTVTGSAVNSNEIIGKILAKLSRNKVACEKMLTSPMSVTVFLKQTDRAKALQALHSLTD